MSAARGTGATIDPGAMLGMFGGGQLGRMFTIAARVMGYRVTVLDPDPDSPAGALADRHLQADYLDDDALAELAATCAAVTTEFENVPASALERLAARCIVRPHAAAVAPTQDRLAEKGFLDGAAIPTVAWAPVEQADDVGPALERVGVPALMKRAQGGYDGKGQVAVTSADGAAAAFATLGSQRCILEQRVELERELSVIVCRAADGTVACYPPGENVHVDGILATTMLPAAIDPALAERAVEIAAAVGRALDYCGVLGVELFVTGHGEILVNELAPRPHNSGHYTLDACVTDQFQQQVRLLCGYGPGDTRLLSPVAMVNLLGDLWQEGDPDWQRVLAEPGAQLHLYGKAQARPGRKMGHVNLLAGTGSEALARARGLLRELGGNPG